MEAIGNYTYNHRRSNSGKILTLRTLIRCIEFLTMERQINIYMSKKQKDESEKQIKKPVEYGDPAYGSEDDIYSQEKKEEFLQDGDDQQENVMDDDLDIPGAELDNQDEAIGEEDEENNYYSLGGDNHEDLENDSQ